MPLQGFIVFFAAIVSTAEKAVRVGFTVGIAHTCTTFCNRQKGIYSVFVPSEVVEFPAYVDKVVLTNIANYNTNLQHFLHARLCFKDIASAPLTAAEVTAQGEQCVGVAFGRCLSLPANSFKS
jgi:hypothetical protein